MKDSSLDVGAKTRAADALVQVRSVMSFVEQGLWLLLSSAVILTLHILIIVCIILSVVLLQSVRDDLLALFENGANPSLQGVNRIDAFSMALIVVGTCCFLMSSVWKAVQNKKKNSGQELV